MAGAGNVIVEDMTLGWLNDLIHLILKLING